MNLKENEFEDIRVLIIGDVMLDEYYFGEVFRQSPEADVPVLENIITKRNLGGAANVALNIKHLGANVSILSVVGKDNKSEILKDMLDEEKIEHHLIQDSTKKTTVKTRVFENKNQLLRIDIEDKSDISEKQNLTLIKKLEELIDDIDVIILQDYDKGVLNKNNISKIIDLAKKNETFCTVDPKFKNFFEYKNVDLFKPNKNELFRAFNVTDNEEQKSLLENLAMRLQENINAKNLLVTLSEDGALIMKEGIFYRQKAYSIDVVDVCGAGDAVISIASLMAFKKYNVEDILKYSMKAGKIVCTQTGVSTITIKDLIN